MTYENNITRICQSKRKGKIILSYTQMDKYKQYAYHIKVYPLTGSKTLINQHSILNKLISDTCQTYKLRKDNTFAAAL